MVLFPPPFYFVFDISNLLSYIQNNFKLWARSPHNGNHFSSNKSFLTECFKKWLEWRRKLKGHGSTWEKMEWIYRICFFIAVLVLSLALLILKKKLLTKWSWTCMRENGVDSPYLFIHCDFSIVANPAYPEEKKKLKRGVSIHVFWTILTILHGSTLRYLKIGISAIYHVFWITYKY